ncbi:uncharacterized protein DNG_06966 [Cephalotrichum gorgonifer]|uniref:Uncharacterized protein n=1 Tax=Cephalotrichum gorgonifer TaxID=2041049 RepID=A0AAE8N3F0_9PEZI|nr:uncharacterized protein DNG_06966 [Cephalotrichum gorgonifer]
MRRTDISIESKVAELAELDIEIRCFLEAALSEVNWEHKLHCVPAAICFFYDFTGQSSTPTNIHKVK